MYLTNFFSEKKSFGIKNKKKTRWLIKKICTDHNKTIGFINCVFCTDDYLLQINKKHLQHNQFTDIITFDFSENKSNLEGDLYISVDRVKDNAKKHKTTLQKELIRVIVHGISHLIGYNDKSKKEKETMTSIENKYVSLYSKK